MKKHNILTKKFLINKYILQKQSGTCIAKQVGCAHVTIYRKLIKFNIKRRSNSESHTGKLHQFFGKKRPKHSKFMKTNNPFTGKQHTRKILKIISEKNLGKHFSPKTEFNSQKLIEMWSNKTFRRKMSLIHGGTGIPYELTNYPSIFYYIKKEIRKRDKYRCVICHKRGKSVHHIDYNKDNCSKDNLITLCFRCHCKTNYNRDYWYAYFKYIMEKANE